MFLMCLNTTEEVVETLGNVIKINLKVRVHGLIIALRYTLTSSSSENMHELLSSVIILVPLAESASMSCTVRTPTWTLSSVRDSKTERLCQTLI